LVCGRLNSRRREELNLSGVKGGGSSKEELTEAAPKKE